MSKPYVPVRQDPKKMAFIRWLTTPPQHRKPRTEREFAEEIDVYHKTLYNWKHDREFNEVWREETDVVVGGDDRRQLILDTLFEAAANPRNPRHVQAAKLYLDAIGAMSPTKIDVAVNGKALGMLEDEEIEMLIARGLAEQRAEIIASQE